MSAHAERPPLPIPADFSARIARLWPGDGERWLADLPDILRDLASRWRLGDLETAPDLSVALVAFARLPSGGEAVLKVGFPHRELVTGYEALRRFEATRGCRVLHVAPDVGAILLERIRPGTPLGAEPDFSVRVRAAAEMVRDLPVPVLPGDERVYPTFASLLDASLASASSHPDLPRELAGYLPCARRLLADLEDGRRPLRLLHGDLRPENILRAEDDGWRSIDPHGWIGVSVLDAGRFIQHEALRHPASDVQERILRLCSDFSDVLRDDRSAVLASAFLNSVRTACWALGRPDRRPALEENLDRCRWILQAL
jgi:streptomycin 6-kinase